MGMFYAEMKNRGAAIMNWSISVGHGESFVPRGARGTSVLIAVALALLFCSAWTSRNPSIDAPEVEVFVTRFAMMGAFVGLALAFRNSEVAFKPIAAFGAIFLLTHLLSGALATSFVAGSSEALALRGISSVFEGFGIAFLELVLFVMVARFRPWLSAVVIASAYLLADVLYCVLLFAPPTVAMASLPVAELLALVVVACVLLLPPLRQPLIDNGADAQKTRSVIALDDNSSLAVSAEGSSAVPLSTALVFVALVTFVWGLVAQMSGGGNIAFFDTTSEFIVIGVRLVVVAFCLLAGATFTFGSVATVSTLIWATGLLVIAVAGDGLGVAIGGLIIKAGLYILQVLVLVLAVRHASEHPERGVFVTGLASCMLLGGQVSRFGWFALDSLVGIAQWTDAVLAWAWWLLVIAVAMALAAMVNNARAVVLKSEKLTESASDGEEGSSDDRALREGADLAYEDGRPVLVGDSPLRRRGIDFCLKFEQFSAEKHLSERERDVLFEALHGRTVEGVAETLFLSRDTVKTYLSRAYARAGVNNKQAVLKLIDEWKLRD